jgi:mono/diheme cytochrome c family protein
VLIALALIGNGMLIYYPRALSEKAPVAVDNKPTTPNTPAPTPPIAPTPPTNPVVTLPPPTVIPPVVTPPAQQMEGGLTLALQSQAGGAIDYRNTRVLSLYVAENSAASPFIAAGPFTATFSGNMNKDVWDFITFSAVGTGALKLIVGEKTVLDIPLGNLADGKPGKIKINKGANPFTLIYTSPTQGDAQLRVFWSSEEFPIEPVPATIFTHDVAAKDLRAANKIRLGRELSATLRCTKCHATDAKAETGLPELAIDAPDLRAIGSRLNQGWMASWLRDPKAMRTHATMPKLIHGAGKTPADLDKEAASIAAYLATLGKAEDGDIANDEATRAKGGHLFGKLGCVTCHSANGNTPAPMDLSYVKAKFKPKALVAFLKAPSEHYKWINMPTFGLSDDEATQLAAYLLHTQTKAPPHTISGGEAELGKVLMAGSGCVNCHQIDGQHPLVLPKLSELGGEKRAKGCLATDEISRGRAPDFGLTSTQVSALRAFVNTDQQSLKHHDMSEFAERRITAQNCIACHQRDGANSTLSGMTGLLEELHASLPADKHGAAPSEEGEHGGAAAGNPPPLLTFTGDKLRPEWMAKFIAGKIPYRPRPWLDMRMPAFPATADLLAKGLAMSHGRPPITPVPIDMEGPTVEDGNKLFGMDGGFNCIQCHSVGSTAAVAIFEAPGINLGYANQRLQKDYYHGWMLNPLRFEPTTRMPKFALDDGTTPLTDVLEGKAKDQFEAIWKYLNEVSKETDFEH